MLLKSSASRFPIRSQGGRRSRLDRFAIFYGLATSALLLVALSQATEVVTEYPLELLFCSITGGLSIFGQLISLRRQASIHFGSFVFCFLFMSAAPIVQMGNNSDFIFKMDHWALLASLNGLAFTAIGVYLTYRMRSPDDTEQWRLRPISKPSSLNFFLVFLITIVTSGIAIALFRNSLFTSREEFGEAAEKVFSDDSLSLVTRMFLFSTPFFGAIIGLRAAVANRNPIWITLSLFGILLAAIVNNPLITPRYQQASLAFFAIDYLFYGKKTKLLAVLLVIGVLLAPLFQVFRQGISNAEVAEPDHRLFATTLLSQDYDSFQVSCYTMLAVNLSGISWGSNILGSALFFVPRALWPEKPRPTAWIIYSVASHSTELGTDNLSTPLMAEGYFAFGWIGALLISGLYWWFISRTTLQSRRDPDSWIFLLRCVFAGLALIFLRGTLTVSVSAVTGSFVAAAVPALFLKLRFGGNSHLRRRPFRVRQFSRAPSNPMLSP